MRITVVVCADFINTTTMKKTTNKTAIPAVNFHLVKSCNMRCSFCFATFREKEFQTLRKGYLPLSDCILILEELKENGFDKVNFAGGEPLIVPFLCELVVHAKKLGMTTSIVTNGYLLMERFLTDVGTHLDYCTLSIDSISDSTNEEAGRAIGGKNSMSLIDYLSKAELIKSSGVKLKVNTVVHSLNWMESLSCFIEQLKPVRWKIFQNLPVKGQNDFGSHLLVSKNEFESYLRRHEGCKSFTRMIAEGNELMTGSYVMIDPLGRFFDDTKGEHTYSQPILNVGLRQALHQVIGDVEKFKERDGFYYK